MRILLGYLVIFGIYFLVKGIVFLPLHIVQGTVDHIGTKEVESTYHGHTSRNIISFPVIAFPAKESEGGADKQFMVDEYEVLSFRDYQAGMPVKVAYKSDHPENARIYSATEYWVPLANMLVLLFACLGWTAGYYFVRRFMREGR